MDNRSNDELAQILWDYNNLNQPPQKSDAILVLGSNDTRVAERGAELFLDGFAPHIIFSGKEGKYSRNIFSKPEANVFAEVAIKMGVPKDKIIIENQSTNTGENIIFTRQLLEKRGLNFKNFLIVQKPYMGRRAYATFKKQWPEANILILAPQISFKDYSNDLCPKDHIINAVVSSTQKIRLYPRLGFQIKQKIPKTVWLAYEELVRRGFTKHLPKPGQS